MLEQQRWLMGPWSVPPADLSHHFFPKPWYRPIFDPDTGHRLGWVSFQGQFPPARWSWRDRPQLTILETDDGSELIRMNLSWFLIRRWSIIDAEDTAVGQIRGNILCDGLGRKFGEIILGPGPRRFHLRELTGREYAVGERRTDGDFVQLVPPEVTNPFLRMILLGAVLSLNPFPG